MDEQRILSGATVTCYPDLSDPLHVGTARPLYGAIGTTYRVTTVKGYSAPLVLVKFTDTFWHFYPWELTLNEQDCTTVATLYLELY